MTAETMQAVVYHAPGDIRLTEVPVPACGDDEVRVAVDACAVCGTDLKSYLHGNPRIRAPLTMGHEFTGLIDTVGRNVTGLAAGDRVVMATSVSCGQCAYCRRDWPNLCANLAPMGFTYPGGMAEYVAIPGLAIERGHVIPVPPGVGPEHAALAEPLSCAVNAAENCAIQPGETVLVVGAGPMGIMNACVARECGAAKVILAEVAPARLRQARAFDFHRVVDSASEDLARAVGEETDGLGADVVIVAAPAAAPQEQAPALARKRGTVCLFASLPKGGSTLAIDSRVIHYGEQRLVGTSDSAPRHVRRAVEMIAAGCVPVERLATHVLGLDGLFEAYELMQSGEALRVVLRP